MKYLVTTPVPGYTGTVAGVHFVNGTAEVESPPPLPRLEDGAKLGRAERAERDRVGQDPAYRAMNYFRAQGYGIEQLDVESVAAHLDRADDAERARVIAAETDGKGRKTITQRGAEGQ